MQLAHDRKTALELFEQFCPDLVILEVNLPEALGYNLYQEMQSRADVFVLFLTTQGNAADQDRGFKQDSFDYLTKPFNLQELGNLVEVILRRKREVTTTEQQCLTFEQLVINPERRQVTLNTKILPLTALEFDLIHYIALDPRRRSKLVDFLQKSKDDSTESPRFEPGSGGALGIFARGLLNLLNGT